MKTWAVRLALPLRVYIGLVFVLASLFKIYDPQVFALSVATYQILPLAMINVFTLFLPWLELIVGASLIAGLWTREAALLVSGMMLMFIAALGIALTKDLKMSCGCFASQAAADEIGVHTVFRDLGWLFCSGFVLICDDGRYGLDRWIKRRG